MKRAIITLLAAVLAFPLLNAQKEGLKYINRNDLVSYMKFLASDEMKGRETGKEENNIAAAYLATNLLRLGIKPIPGSDTYLQDIPFISRSIERNASKLTATDGSGKTIFSTDSVVALIPPTANLTVTGDLVFAGYGYEDKASGYSDLKDVDLADKIVMIMTRNPVLTGDPKTKNEYRFDESVEIKKIMMLMGKKPKAILFVYDAKNHFHDPYTSGLSDMLGGENSVSLANSQGMTLPIKILFITDYTADMLLAGTGKTLAQLQSGIDTGNKPLSQPMKNETVTFSIRVVTRNFTGHNVVGLVEGSDPVLKDECVIYSAHYDHLGVNNKGEVYNGADDNASGTTGLLEVADAFAHLKKKPSRTVIFLWVTGEEKGLLGSQYYVNHPVMPMNKTILNINLDMIGRSISPADTGTLMGFKMDITKKNEVLLYSDRKSSWLMKTVMDEAAKLGLKVDDVGPKLESGGSDHMSFASKKVPFLFFNSGIHADLHSVRDDVEKIDFEKMEKVTDLVYLIGFSVASSKEGVKADSAK
ncbi:MAG TPA: M20/M25/M40 family metallo-hydrolase [Bacteroidales bacterium]|nr:M20/M25/M40 family metallo-hydrolase [Bacteroidales bacterium]